MLVSEHPAVDLPTTRKARGAFFTPAAMSEYVVSWALRSPEDHVLEPSCGEAAFLLEAAKRLAHLGTPQDSLSAQLNGVEVHEHSARHAENRLAEAGAHCRIETADFFTVAPVAKYDAVVGNPPYVRYQDFTGAARTRSRAAALQAGVALSGLASSWAAFTVHSALFLKTGGRLGLVLPAELLSVNYASEVRKFLMGRFRNVRLVMFSERVFPGVLEEVVLLLADGFNEGPTDHCDLHQANNLEDLDKAVGRRWKPEQPPDKWTASLLSPRSLGAISTAAETGTFGVLEDWGDTTLGMVTGNNGYFAMSPSAAQRLGIEADELLPVSPPGSRHLRGLGFTLDAWNHLGEGNKSTLLFNPSASPSAAAQRYIDAGEATDVNLAYKCRVRSPWWKVPLVKPAHLFLTYMNADTPRLCANKANVRHFNSVHGVYLKPELVDLGQRLLPLASLNSMTLLGAEVVGRSYGGGMLKIEPKEADRLPLPSAASIEAARTDLLRLEPLVAEKLQSGRVTDAARLVDEALLVKHLQFDPKDIAALREAHAEMYGRRISRGPRPKILLAASAGERG